MCIIASVPAGKSIPAEHLSNMWDNNRHGGGIGYIDENNVVQIEKDMTKDGFMKKYEDISRKYGNRDMVVHFRIATAGSVCLDNTHPFRVNKQTVMAHNGILPDFFDPPKKSDLSDTRFMIETLLSRLDMTALDDSWFCDMLDELINSDGYPNKLVFLSNDKRLKKDSYIIGEKLGTWDNGIWYSNTSFQAKPWSMPKKNGKQTTITSMTATEQCQLGDDWFMDDDYTNHEFTGYDIPSNIVDGGWDEVGMVTYEEVLEIGQAKPDGNSITGWVCSTCEEPVTADSRDCKVSCDGYLEACNYVYETDAITVQDASSYGIDIFPKVTTYFEPKLFGDK